MRSAQEVLGVSAGATVEQVRAAYRALARRWHPDRFAPGPEREWASDHMAEINAAYRDALKAARKNGPVNEDEAFRRAARLIEDGEFSTARELLMTMPTRCAEWNYLFGEVLMRLSEYKKALIYLSVATHQNPDSAKYAAAYSKALNRGVLPRKRSFFH